MKTKIQNLFLMLALLALSTLNLQLSTVFAQTTAFTYQGRLNVNGSPANGLYDLRFTVCDALTNGNIIAGPLTNSATGVTNGLFAVALDFGSGVFTGPDRWLQLDVRTNGNGVFTNLSPRQPITPVPYALYSQKSSGSNQTLTGSGITLGSGGTSWDIGVANNALTFSYGDPLVTLTNTPDGSLGVPNNITAGGNITTDGGLQIGGTSWNVNVGTGTGPASYSLPNCLIFSANGVPCLDVVDMPGNGNGPAVWAPNQLGAMEVNCGGMNVNDSSWNSVVSIDSDSGIVVSDADGNTLAQIDSQGNLYATRNLAVIGDGEVGGPYGNPLYGNITANGDGQIDGFLNVGHDLNVGGNLAVDGCIHGDFCEAGNLVAGTVSAKTLNTTSDRNLKEKFTPIDNQEILERVASLPISTWNFKTDPAIRHVGPMAQDFYAAFSVGMDDKHIATVDEEGVALAAIQGLNQKLNEKDAEIQALKQSVAELKETLTHLTQQSK
jgi:hypothetical protein